MFDKITDLVRQNRKTISEHYVPSDAGHPVFMHRRMEPGGGSPMVCCPDQSRSCLWREAPPFWSLELICNFFISK